MIVLALVVMVVTQAVVVAASLTVPILGPQLTAALGVEPALIGYYTSIVFIGALLSGQIAPQLIRRHGAVRVSQFAALLAAAGLAVSGFGALAGIVAGALLIGFAYGPGNPASSSLLSAVTPPARRGFFFSLKQTAVPIGGTAAGAALPILAIYFGWRAAVLAVAILCVVVAAGVEAWRRPLDAHRPAPGQIRAISPFRLLAADRALLGLALVSACMASVQFSVSAIFVTLLVETTDAGLAASGTAFSVAMGGSVALRVVLGALADRFGGMRVLRGLAVIMAVFATIGGLAASGVIVLGFAGLAPVLVVLGTTAFSWNGVYLAEVAAAAPPEHVGSATAGTMSFVFLGGIFGPVLFTTATVAAGNYGGGLAFAALLSVAAALLLSRRHQAATLSRTDAPPR